MGPEVLSRVLGQLPKIEDENLLVGIDTTDDAAVYKISDKLALIQTLDFFTPVVNDPYMFGQIAAANALSDVYAMGGKPLLALNIVCFPNCINLDILAQILKGGADKVMEAGAIIAGGHTLEDDEPKYGLSVSGLVDPENIITNRGAGTGDYLVLTKPLGTGIINTGIKGDLVGKEMLAAAVEVMSALNKGASEAMVETGVSACTDITGFGLLGHAAEMARASSVSLQINKKSIPLIEGAKELAAIGMIPGGAYNNKKFLAGNVKFDQYVEPAEEMILYDPQTSGGLLIAVKENKLNLLIENLRKHGATVASVIGRVVEKGDFLIKVVNEEVE